MDVTETDLKAVRDLCLGYYADEESNIRSIILYGSAARSFSGQDHTPRDFDLNIFFSERAAVSSTHGMPKVIGEHDGLDVEVMRNKVPEEMNIPEYTKVQNSKRWERILDEPIVQVYPDIKQVDWG